MVFFSKMNLGVRFNLVLILIFAALMTFNTVEDYARQHELIRRDAVNTSRLMARQIIETRSYLSSEIKDAAGYNQNLIPQVAATRIAAMVSRDSRYTLRQTSLRYRNPDNRPDQYESAVLEKFRKGNVSEHFEMVTLEGNEILRYLVPMIADQSCLECHGSFESAPEFVRQRFPKNHFSYNYKAGEVIGAVSVSIPMTDLYNTIGKNLRSDILFSGVIVLIILILTAFLIRRFVIAPIERLSATLSHVSETGMFDTQLPVTGTDEISQLVTAYNSMISELNSKCIQRQESDERYRNLIDMARSAIVTFIGSGRIVIVNRSAERLLGSTRSELTGEDLFGFLDNGEAMKEELQQSFKDDRPWEGATFRMKIRRAQRDEVDVELAVSASFSDGHPMFTAIIRDMSQS